MCRELHSVTLVLHERKFYVSYKSNRFRHLTHAASAILDVISMTCIRLVTVLTCWCLSRRFAVCQVRAVCAVCPTDVHMQNILHPYTVRAAASIGNLIILLTKSAEGRWMSTILKGEFIMDIANTIFACHKSSVAECITMKTMKCLTESRIPFTDARTTLCVMLCDHQHPFLKEHRRNSMS